MDITIYKILLWALPILLAVLAFIGGLAVKALIQMSIDINAIKMTIATESAKREAIERRIEIIEEKIFRK